MAAMDAETLKAIQEAVQAATSGMVSWQVLTGAGTIIGGAIGTAFKILWSKYAEARDKLEAAEKERADKAEKKVEGATNEALAFVQSRDKLAKEITAAWQARVDEWKGRYFGELNEYKVKVNDLQDKLRDLLEKLQASIPTALNDNTKVIEENNEILEAIGALFESLQSLLPKVETGLGATAHNYNNLRPILHQVSELYREARGGRDEHGESP